MALMLSRLDDPLAPDRPLIVILGDDTDEEDHDLLFPALRARGVSVIRVHPHDIVTRMDPDEVSFSVGPLQLRPDLVVGWVLDDLLVPGMSYLDAFARLGVPVINDAMTLFRAQNKFLDSTLLSDGGALRYPVITGRDDTALEDWLEDLDAPAVVKPLVGYGGRGIEKLADAADAPALLARLRERDEGYYVVPWIDNPGRDIRVYTVNHHPVFAMYRYAPPGKWITNILAGGNLAPCPLTPELSELAARASRAAGTLIGGIDIGENRATDELVVYEVNSCPTCEPPAIEAVADFLATAAVDLEQARATWRPARIHTDPPPDPELFHASKRDRIRPD